MSFIFPYIKKASPFFTLFTATTESSIKKLTHTTHMDSSSPENLFDDRNKVLQGLIRGRESVNQLRLILEKPLGDDKSSVAVDDLVTKILGSFTESISMLNWRPIKEVFDKIPANTGGNSPSSNGRKYDESEESSKSTSAFKERRGCYKRRYLSFSFHFFSLSVDITNGFLIFPKVEGILVC